MAQGGSQDCDLQHHLQDLPEHHMLPIQVRRRRHCDEEPAWCSKDDIQVTSYDTLTLHARLLKCLKYVPMQALIRVQL